MATVLIRIKQNLLFCKKMTEIMKMNESIKETKNKLRWSLMPMKALEEVMKVIDFGANKYEINSWQNNTIQECYDALFRHLVKFENKYHNDEYPIDDESGLDHMAHIATNALFILYLCKKNKENKLWRETKVRPIREETPEKLI